MTGYLSNRKRSSRALSIALSLVSLFLVPCRAIADDAKPDAESETLRWARVDFLRNRVQLLPATDQARRARISDILQIGDSLRTMRRSRAELRFNDDSLARIGERATFQFTPNTRNFQLANGTVLLLIPPGKGRSTIQTPNAVTGIQGSALFVRYIPETDTTIVGALTDNPDGPMVLFNRDGTEQQALRANEIGVIEGNQITELYRFDSQLFWESSGLAEGLNISEGSTDSNDPLAGVHQEIREAIAKRDPLPSDGAGVIENPSSFSRPDENAPVSTPGDNLQTPSPEGSPSAVPNTDDSEADQPQSEAGEGTTNEATSRPNSGVIGSTTSTTDTTTDEGASTNAPSTVEDSVNSDSNSSNEAPAVSQSTGNVLTPIPESSSTLEPIEETALGEDFVDTEEEPAIKIEFEDSPAEAYLSAPPTALPEQSAVDGGNKLINLEPPAEGENSEDVTGTETLPVVPPDDAPASDPDSLSRPLTDETKDPNTTDDVTESTDDLSVDQTNDSLAAPAPSTPRAPEPVLTTPPEQPTEQSPTEQSPTEQLPTEQPVEEPTAEPPTDTTAPPILLESAPNPETAEPATLPNAPPVLDPSTTLMPVELEDAGVNDVLIEDTGSEPQLELPDPLPTEPGEPAPPAPVQAPEPVIEATPSLEAPEPVIEAPEPVIEADPSSELVPETVLESVDAPESAPIIETFENEVPFNEPEVGGASLDETLDPVDVPEQITDDTPEPRGFTDSPNNPENSVSEPQIEPQIELQADPQAPEPVIEERLLL